MILGCIMILGAMVMILGGIVMILGGGWAGKVMILATIICGCGLLVVVVVGWLLLLMS